MSGRRNVQEAISFFRLCEPEYQSVRRNARHFAQDFLRWCVTHPLFWLPSPGSHSLTLMTGTAPWAGQCQCHRLFAPQVCARVLPLALYDGRSRQPSMRTNDRMTSWLRSDAI